MKKWLYVIVALAAIGLLSRLPHPSRDISKLEPVQAVYVYMEAGELHIETDTGDHGSGKTLAEATDDMKAASDGEIFLETAEFLILAPGVPIASDFYDLLRPDCKVCTTFEPPDLPAAAQYLSLHTPKTTLAHLASKKGT